jgi:hypothetical protein
MMPHTFITWVVANLLHPLVWVLFIQLKNVEPVSIESVQGLFLITVFTFIFSLPSLFLASLLLSLIAKSFQNINVRFVVWVFSVTVIPMINCLILDLIAESWKITGEAFELAIPATIATFIAVLIRYKQFSKLFIQQKNENHENTMV